MTIKELQKQAYETATKSGWHETERSPLEYHALIHSEVSEATEEARIDCTEPIYQGAKNDCIFPNEPLWDKYIKPEGELIELADAIIRIADYCESRDWDLEKAIKIKMDFNKTREWRHGGKKY